MSVKYVDPWDDPEYAADMRRQERAEDRRKSRVVGQIERALLKALDLARAEWGASGYNHVKQLLAEQKEAYDPTVPRYEKRKIGVALRFAVYERDGFSCRSCGARRNLSLDHLIPEAQGGETSLENLQTLCRSCNAVKGTKPATHQLNLLTTGRRLSQ